MTDKNAVLEKAFWTWLTIHFGAGVFGIAILTADYFTAFRQTIRPDNSGNLGLLLFELLSILISLIRGLKL